MIVFSRAIMQYLMDKYAKDDSLYPKDLKTRAVINARLNFDCGTLWPRLIFAYVSHSFNFQNGFSAQLQ